MPMVRPAPLKPLPYSGLMLYLLARSITVYEPGALPTADLGATSPASAPVFGTTAECLRKLDLVLIPDTEVAIDASAAGITGAVAGAWKAVPASEYLCTVVPKAAAIWALVPLALTSRLLACTLVTVKPCACRKATTCATAAGVCP